MLKWLMLNVLNVLNDVEYDLSYFVSNVFCSRSVRAKVNTYPDFHGTPRLANVVGMPRTARGLQRSADEQI